MTTRSVMMAPGVYVVIRDDAARSATVVPGIYVSRLGVAPAGVEQTLLANDVGSASSVSNPALTEGAPPTETTIFESLTPAVADETGDSNAVSLGTKWRSDEPGFVTGGRFYKGAATGGNTHTVALYGGAGGVMASKVTTGLETASGWQEFTYTTPVAILPGIDYWAVTHWPGGRYPYTLSFFGPVYDDNPPLSASQSKYYYDSVIRFPDQAATANFFSDVVFEAGGDVPDYLTVFEDLVPASPVNADSAVSLGQPVVASQNGYVIGVRFYKGDTSGGNTHTVALYSNAGSLLASKVTTGLETASGWQNIEFDTPVAITGGAQYWAVTHWPGGGYPVTDSFFSGQYYNGPLVAAAGQYEYGASLTFPDSGITGNDNFYSDIMFVGELPAADTEDDLLANDVASASSVTQPAVHQVHGVLANDVTSASSVGQPAVKQLHGILANDASSASSVTQPTQLKQLHGILANDVASASSVTQPTQLKQLHNLLANDVASASSVTVPALHQAHNLLANDIVSASTVGVPSVLLPGTIEANDVASASSVTVPALHQTQNLLANDVTSASTVGVPSVVLPGIVLANDVTSASSVTRPATHQNHAFLANDIASASSVSQPTAAIVGEPEVTTLRQFEKLMIVTDKRAERIIEVSRAENELMAIKVGRGQARKVRITTTQTNALKVHFLSTDTFG